MVLIFQDCVHERQLFGVTEQFSPFDDAQSFCFDQGGQLAIPRSLSQFNEILEFQQLPGFQSTIWVGLTNSDVSSDPVPARFLGVNGESIPFMNEVEAGEFPWTFGEPSVTPDEACVEIRVGDQLLNNQECVNVNQFVCERSCVSECNGGMKYVMNTQLSNFTGAQAYCNSIGGQLAIPTSSRRFQNILNLGLPFNERILIGLIDNEDLGESNTQRFIGVDGQPNGFTNREPFQFPWDSTEPNDSLGNENCVAIDPNFSENLRDVDCSLDIYASICEIDCSSRPAFVFDECFEGTQFYFSTETLTFDESSTICKNVDINGKLAIPQSVAKYDRMVSFIQGQSNSILDPGAWLGLRNFLEEPLGTLNFLTVDGDFNSFTSDVVGLFPWKDGEPSNIDNQFCVVLDYDTFEMNDRSCQRNLQSLCERPCVNEKLDSPFVFNTCIDGTQLFLNPVAKNFDEANEACSNFDDLATLAVPSSEEKYLEMKNFKLLTGTINPYVGLRNFAEDITADTASFLTIDGKPNPFTSREQGVFPWQTGEPNNFANLNQFCGVIADSGGDLDDGACDLDFPSICERYCGIRPNFIFDECDNQNMQYFFNPELRTFDAAEADCRSAGGTLAVPKDETIFVKLLRLFQLFKVSNVHAFIGLRGFFDEALDTADFLTVDGSSNVFTSGNIGEVPWISDEPNGINGVDRCVAISSNENGIFDTICTNTGFSICQRSCSSTNIVTTKDILEIDSVEDVVIIVGVLVILVLLLKLTFLLMRKKKELKILQMLK